MVAAYQSGGLVNLVFRELGLLEQGERDAALSTCAHLHNDKQIDVLALTVGSALDAVEGATFFVGQDFLCDLIPQLDAPVEEMMRAVSALVARGGQDLTASEPYGAFREWCAVDLSRARQVVAAARAEDELAGKFLTFALLAGGFRIEAIDFVHNYPDDRRLAAITALGRMPYDGPEAAGEALAALSGALTSDSADILNGNILLSSLSVLEKVPGVRADVVRDVISRIASSNDAGAKRWCALALRRHGKSLDAELIVALMRPFDDSAPLDEVIVRDVDAALRTLLHSHAQLAIDCAAKLVSSDGGAVDSALLETFAGSLRRGPKEMFYRTLITWLVGGDSALCDWIASLVGEPDDAPIEVPQGALVLQEEELISLCKRAIGYLFLKPVCCSSILVAVLRADSSNAANVVRQLLFDPMLVNYGGKLRDYLESIGPEDPVHEAVGEVLKAADQYVAGLAAVGLVRELIPSERHRQVEHERSSDEMRKAFKKAQRASALLSLLSQSVILHGHRSLTFVEVPGQPPQPVEVTLQSHGVTFEMPRMQLIDPLGLDYMLRVFRTEGRNT